MVWDAWYMSQYDRVHAYHLQRTRSGEKSALQDCLGHAVTRDLIHWEERPAAFAPSEQSTDDDLQPWTGCALWHEGKGYLYYTMRGSANEGREQKIGLAVTRDADSWTRYSVDPVLVPDARYYATREYPVPGIVDCRDMHVIRSPRGGWLGFFATRIDGAELPETSVIGCAHSEDLVHWKQLPPAFAPGKYACVEVPDVFFLNGKWYMMCLVGNHYGNRGIWADSHLVNGTIYAVSENPEGPYEELADNALIAARTTGPIAARSLNFQDELFVLYTDRERKGRVDTGEMTFGTLSTPKLLRTSGDQLEARYCARVESLAEDELFIQDRGLPEVEEPRPWGQIWPKASGAWTGEGTITGVCRSGWSVRSLGCQAESFIFEARVEIENGVSAGFALRMDSPMRGAIVALDFEEQSVFFAEGPSFEFEEKRRVKVRRCKAYHLRVVQRVEHIEIYVDDVLKLAFSRYRGIGGEMGLFVDRGRAMFTECRIRSLAARAGGEDKSEEASGSENSSQGNRTILVS